MEKAHKFAARAYQDWFLSEVEEDLNNLAVAIAQFGITVHQPRVHNLSEDGLCCGRR